MNTAADLFDDFNGDGFPDAIFYNFTTFTVVLGGPAGVQIQTSASSDFESDPTYSAGPSADFDGDGFTDLASLVVDSLDLRVAGIQLGGTQGLGPISEIVTLNDGRDPLPIGTPVGIGDFDGDGFEDLAWPLRYGNYVLHGCAGGPPIRTGGAFTCDTCQDIDVAAGDFNGDGLFDVAYGDGVGVHISPGGSPLPNSLIYLPITSEMAADLNADGYSDLLGSVPNDPTSAQVYTGGPSGLAAQSLGGTLPIRVGSIGDFNGDGLWDYIDWQTGQVNYANPGPWGASFTPGPAVGWTYKARVVDINGDGYDDLVAAGGPIMLGSADGVVVLTP